MQNTPLKLVPLLAMLAAAAAQVTPPSPTLPAQDGRVPIHSHQGGDDPDYGIWAAMPGYKVSFHAGFAFYPLLGDAYPENLPLRWQATAVTAGGQAIAVPTGAVQRRSDWRFEYDHGAFREVYDVRDAGVEQSFVVAQRPPVAGDLVIRGRIDTALRCAPQPAAHQALVFRDQAGRPIVRYGEAFAIDALGRRVDALTAFDGEHVTLRVDGAWLAQAQFPVVVDPLTSPVVIGSGSSPVASCDVGVEGESLARNVVFAVERAFSATDHDVWAYACDRDFANRTVIMSDLSSANDDRNVTVAFVAGADRWLVGFQRGYTAGGNQASTIRVYYHNKGNTLPNSGVAFSIPQVFVEFYRNPDLGGTFLGGSGVHGLLVYTSDSSSGNGNHTAVVAVPIDASTRQFLSAYQVGSSNVGTTFDREAPSVNQTSAAGDGWVVLYQELNRTIANDDWDLVATRTGATGAELASAVAADASGARHLTTPQVSGMNGSYVLTYTASTDLTMTAGAQLLARRMDWAVALPAPLIGSAQVLGAALPPSTFLTNAGLASNHFIGSTAVAVWTRTSLVNLEFTRSAVAARLSGAGAVVDAQTMYSVQGESAISPAVSFAYPGEEYAIVYGTTEGTQNELTGRRYQYPAAAGEFRYGTACGPAVIDGHRPYLGNHNYGVGYVFGPAQVPAALFVAIAPGSVPLQFLGMTGCVLNLDPTQLLLSLPGTSDPAGTLRIPLPLPESVLQPYDLYCQIAYVSPGANPASLQSTQGLRAQVR